MKAKVGFWILGLCNNFAYVIMLSAALDLLHPSHDHHHDRKIKNQTVIIDKNSTTTDRDCNPLSTGAVLLADVVPTILIKMISPFINLGIQYRIIMMIFLISASFILVAISNSAFITFSGIICAALAAGLGEASLLAFSSQFDNTVIRYWSSGTGGAGIVGSLAYALLTGVIGLTPRMTILSMLIIPVIFGVSFWFLVYPFRTEFRDNYETIRLFDIYDGGDSENSSSDDDNDELNGIISTFRIRNSNGDAIEYNLKTKLKLIPGLFKYMIPLGLVYIFEYLINQGLFELVYFPDITNYLTHAEQYRWMQVDYQIGVFISRSSMVLLTIDKIWLLSIFQFINFFVLLPQAIYWFIPSFWIVLLMVFWEGLLGGAAYANTFRKLRSDIESKEHQEFALGITSLADSTGVAIAGLISIPLHNKICNLPI